MGGISLGRGEVLIGGLLGSFSVTSDAGTATPESHLMHVANILFVFKELEILEAERFVFYEDSPIWLSSCRLAPKYQNMTILCYLDRDIQ